MFVVNKWDLMLPTPTSKYAAILYDQVRAMPFAPTVFITGKTGKNVKALLNLGQNLFKQAAARVSTAELNSIVEKALAAHPPPRRQNRLPKIYYGTQVGVCPPTVVLFCNSPKLFGAPYQRYLMSTLREALPFPEVPIKMYLRGRREPVSAEPLAPETTEKR